MYERNACTKCETANGSEFHRIQHEAVCAGPGATWLCEGCGSTIPHISVIDTHRMTCSRPIIRAVPLPPPVLDLDNPLP